MPGRLKTETTNLNESPRKIPRGSCFFVLSRGYFLSFLLLATLLSVSSCSVPNLEESECVESRDAVKQFYSFHLANDMKPSLENFRARERFLTKKLAVSLETSHLTDFDPFTATGDYPKAFRVGECKVLAPGKTQLQVILFWRDDNRSEQKEVTVDAVKQDNKWLIDNVIGK